MLSPTPRKLYNYISKRASSAASAASTSPSSFRFEILHRSRKSRARVGIIHTPHGPINTPGFVPVATNGVLKHVPFELAEQVGTELVFANTYHLIIHPGPTVIEKAGGIHKFVHYRRPMITDSGGFQVFSLSNVTSQDELKGKVVKQTKSSVLKIDEEGVLFRNYRNGSPIKLTPESSVQAQKQIGADIIIPLDILLPNAVEKSTLTAAFDRTHRWELRSLQEHLRNPKDQVMYGVNHGGTDLDMRIISAKFIASQPFKGMAIGGSVGKDSAEMFDILDRLSASESIPETMPVHLLGIADPNNVEHCVRYGLDTFDSCFPVRVGRHGYLLSENGPIKIRRTDWKSDTETPCVPDPTSPIYKYSRATLHHMHKQNEPLAEMLGSLHNIHFMVKHMERIREKILRDEI